MNIEFSPSRSDSIITYHVDGDVVYATVDGQTETFDFSRFLDGKAAEFRSSLNPCPVLKACRVGGKLCVTLLRAVPKRPQTNDAATLNAWRALWTTEVLLGDTLDQPPKGDVRPATITWKSQDEIGAEREAEAWSTLRAERGRRLLATDWIMLPDTPVPTGTTREQWEAYRQALRDVPQQPGAPHDVEWPEPPSDVVE